jgi:phosphoribosylaminoimidazolecarboxamide formyltransferase/IMP cyclohydrolase
MNKKLALRWYLFFIRTDSNPRNCYQILVLQFTDGWHAEIYWGPGVPVTPVENLTLSFHSCEGSNLHPSVRWDTCRRDNETDVKKWHLIFGDRFAIAICILCETVASTNDEKLIIEKIDIGGHRWFAVREKFQRRNRHSIEGGLRQVEKILRTHRVREFVALCAKAFDIVGIAAITIFSGSTMSVIKVK